MKLNRVNTNVYYIDGGVNLGLVVGENGDALLLDAGIDESVARKARRLIEESGFRLKGIIITHAHADHCGGAPYLVKATGAKVFSSAFEKTVLEFPIWEPLYLFSGAYPPAPLRNKFLLAPGVKVDGVMEPGKGSIEGIDVEFLDISGHTLGQIGIEVEGVLFCADSVIAQEYIKKHGVPLHAHIKKALDTLNFLEKRSAALFIPSHGVPVDDIKPVVDANRQRIMETLEYVTDILKEPRTAEEILRGVCERFGIVMSNMTQYYLMNLSVMAYIGYLLDEGEIMNFYEAGRQFFRVKM
ncbi:MAG: MBL fold metallo-hydrolase [Thermosediminibacteraceae bacterium]|nr:MBL fold metallo-hydrolase [Thermosediminibacteraceae bacterium]